MLKETMFSVYIIYSAKFDKHYVGMTSNLEKRLKAHNSNTVKSTKPYSPWEYVHIEHFETRLEARKREIYLKSAAGRRWRKNNLGH